MAVSAELRELVVVANRLPVDRQTDEQGNAVWRTSPGGLVAALTPVMQATCGAWVGWPGTVDEATDPFDHEGMRLLPVSLSADEVNTYYEGFANGTLWPLYHDVIVPPEYHRAWWDSYVQVNQQFAEAAVAAVQPGGVVWVHDYQLQLVPALVRAQRSDVRVVFFNHIPFPAPELFAQLPWRTHILEGLLGADVVGFQRQGDAQNFARACCTLLQAQVRGEQIQCNRIGDRVVHTTHFPISIDFAHRESMARTSAITTEVIRIRANMGGRQIVLGVDRLDYIKGITHRLKAYGELLEEQRINPRDVVLVQVATPSRERVAQYQLLRDEVELTVGRLNGDYSTLGRPAVHYLHKSFGATDMAALYRAADVLLVTSLRDGMNLVAKEYIASRFDHRGVLVLSEFAGAADELRQAVHINPHDIDGTKSTIVDALAMSSHQQKKRMTKLRDHVREYDVKRWAKDILASVNMDIAPEEADSAVDSLSSSDLRTAVGHIACHRPLLVATDFDGTLAPLVKDRDKAAPLPEAIGAIAALADVPHVHVALVSGRGLRSLAECANPPHGTHLIAGHGAEVDGEPIRLTDDQLRTYATLQHAVEDLVAEHPGTDVELKPTALVLHTRSADKDVARRATAAAVALGEEHESARTIVGKEVVEFAVVEADKGSALVALRDSLGAVATVYVGDDTTDEDAFEQLVKSPSTKADLTVKVGTGRTAATHRVADPQEVAALLQALCDGIAEATGK